MGNSSQFGAPVPFKESDFGAAVPVGETGTQWPIVPREGETAQQTEQRAIKQWQSLGKKGQPKAVSKSLANAPFVPGVKDIAKGNVAKGLHEELSDVGLVGSAAAIGGGPITLMGIASAPLAIGTSMFAGMAGRAVGYEAAKKMGLTDDQAKLAGDILSLASAYGGFKGGTKLSAAARNLRAAIMEWAQEEPNVAAMKGVGVSPKSKYAQRVLQAIKEVRPYMKGVSSELDLQQRIPMVKKEVWAPYKEAIGKYGDTAVVGPDGPTTLGQLESERLKLSAINNAAKNKDPVALQNLMQQGRTVAQSVDREAAVTKAIDSALERRGVPAGNIRKKYGQFTEIQKRVNGRIGSMVKSPYGLGRIFGGARGGAGFGESGEFRGHGLFITERLANILPAINDFLAGRPLWSGSPIDIGIREGFRPVAGEVAGVAPVANTPVVAGLLGEGSKITPPPPDVSSVRSVPAVTPVYEARKALPAGLPPIPLERSPLGAEVRAMPAEPVEYGQTRAVRTGRLLPEGEGTGPLKVPYQGEPAGSAPTSPYTRGYSTEPQPLTPVDERRLLNAAIKFTKNRTAAGLSDYEAQWIRERTGVDVHERGGMAKARKILIRQRNAMSGPR